MLEKDLPHAQRNENIVIIDRMKKSCVICGAAMKVILYNDRSYRGGHYFGKIPLQSKREVLRALKAGTHSIKMGNHTLNVLNRDPKPYGKFEYCLPASMPVPPSRSETEACAALSQAGECVKCYWKG